MKLFIEISTSIYIPVYIVSTQKDFQLQFNLLSKKKEQFIKSWKHGLRTMLFAICIDLLYLVTVSIRHQYKVYAL